MIVWLLRMLRSVCMQLYHACGGAMIDPTEHLTQFPRLNIEAILALLVVRSVGLGAHASVRKHGCL